jgi:hypothetical protein
MLINFVLFGSPFKNLKCSVTKRMQGGDLSEEGDLNLFHPLSGLRISAYFMQSAEPEASSRLYIM